MIWNILLWCVVIGTVIAIVLWFILLYIGSREQIEDHDNFFQDYEEDRR